jgi:hypothetical protein
VPPPGGPPVGPPVGPPQVLRESRASGWINVYYVA